MSFHGCQELQRTDEQMTENPKRFQTLDFYLCVKKDQSKKDDQNNYINSTQSTWRG